MQTKFLKVVPSAFQYTALVPVKTQDDTTWFLTRYGMNPVKLLPHSACQTVA